MTHEHTYTRRPIQRRKVETEHAPDPDAMAALCKPLSAKVMPATAAFDSMGVPLSEARVLARQRWEKR